LDERERVGRAGAKRWHLIIKAEWERVVRKRRRNKKRPSRQSQEGPRPRAWEKTVQRRTRERKIFVLGPTKKKNLTKKEGLFQERAKKAKFGKTGRKERGGNNSKMGGSAKTEKAYEKERRGGN